MVRMHEWQGVEELDEMLELATAGDKNPQILVLDVPLDRFLPMEPAATYL